MLRLVPIGGGLTLRIDEVRADDTTFDHAGRTVLAVGPGVAQR